MLKINLLISILFTAFVCFSQEDDLDVRGRFGVEVLYGECHLQSLEPTHANGFKLFFKGEVQNLLMIGCGVSSIKSNRFETKIIEDGVIVHEQYRIKNNSFFTSFELKHAFHFFSIYGGVELHLGLNKTSINNYVQYASYEGTDKYISQTIKNPGQLSYAFVPKAGFSFTFDDFFSLKAGYAYTPINIVPIPFTNNTPFGRKSIRVSSVFIGIELIIPNKKSYPEG